MTTKEAEARYLGQHLQEQDGKGYAIYNPHNKPIDELPFIMGFNNGGSPGWYHAVAIAEDGHCLGGHVCSNEGYMRADLGILEGTRQDRHDGQYKLHYPDGYRMDFVEDTKDERLQKALELNRDIASKAISNDGENNG